MWGDERMPQSFWDKVQPEPNSGCWLWTGALDRKGYGRLMLGGKEHRIHRTAYIKLTEAKAEQLVCDHLCRTRCCVNPDHIELVTLEENVRRGEAGINNRVKTRCPQGHEYCEKNARLRHGRRYCRECDKLYQRARRARGPQ